MSPQSTTINFDDMQVLLRFGNGRLSETLFLLLTVKEADAAGRWIENAPISNATTSEPPPETSLQIAFSAPGLAAIGLPQSVIDEFSDEFIEGMAGDANRSRRLGDVAHNDPAQWAWGGELHQAAHILLLLYATPAQFDAWCATVLDAQFQQAFDVLSELPTDTLQATEPFGFVDGISQPRIDWAQKQSTDSHDRASYFNWLSPGDVVLGYENEYGQYTPRPLLDPDANTLAAILPDATDVPGKKDLGCNGTYLVIRQLQQDVPGFWQYIDRTANADPTKREQLAAKLVGRQRDGTPLDNNHERGPGVPNDSPKNQFTYAQDPRGHECPVGAHIRRTNPRTGDYPPGATSPLRRLIRALGFGLSRPEDDLIASTRFHRLLRRGRNYGPLLPPEEAVKTDAPAADRGLQFICLVGNIKRQFEFVQNAWIVSSKFGGVQDERDPLLGHHTPLLNGASTDCFRQPDPRGPTHRHCELNQFITVKGGGYFFMPGLRAIKYLASLAIHQDGSPT